MNDTDQNLKKSVPNYPQLVTATFKSLKTLGGSGTNNEISKKASEILELSDEILAIPHVNDGGLSEVNYRLAWARTFLKLYGAIENSARSVWSITSKYLHYDSIDGNKVDRAVHRKSKDKLPDNDIENKNNIDDISDIPEEVRPWRKKLFDILMSMNPYDFELLTQRVLRECDFIQVEVTKKSGDGGIDGTGKLKINGIITFNIAFQCKRYRNQVSASEIRDFRGSLSTDIEKAIFITTGAFSRPAIEEASNKGKQQIDLINGEEFIDLLVQYKLGIREIKDYEIDEDFFLKYSGGKNT